ncbi:helix-turn-helix domain-containing protein [Uliginosibacterium sediminicola]|uniref:helix-turn-helix domain-containing protein n=1 Tax=Uliginosibacterium sediminicola TaxID=2024550 RepID=UPI003D098884
MTIKTPHDIKKITGKTMLRLREKLKLNQSDFWGPVGVTQSAGSRYESGRNIPDPVRIAIAHYYSPEIQQHKRSLAAA